MSDPAPSAPPAPVGVIPYLVAANAAAAISFYEAAFGAREVLRHMADDGRRVFHATLVINDGLLYLSDDFPEFTGGHTKAPDPHRPSPVSLHMRVSDVDQVFAAAVAAGAKVEMPVADMFWGDRFGKLRDPAGHTWSISTPIPGHPTRAGS